MDGLIWYALVQLAVVGVLCRKDRRGE